MHGQHETDVDFSVLAGTTKEHLGYALALGVPVIVVVNKVDLCPASSVERLVRQLETILKSPGCKKIPFRVNSEDDAITVASNLDSNKWGLAYYLCANRLKLVFVQVWGCNFGTTWSVFLIHVHACVYMHA